MKPKLKLNILLLVLLSLPALARAQGTAFSYQGHLVGNGAAANAGYDFIFALFGSAAGVDQIGAAVPLNNVAVANGQFNVTLDFGAGAFTGSPRWLEISVRPAGAGLFTKMAGRVSLLPTPYAIFAATAGSVPDAALTANQLNTGGVAPLAGQFLTYNGANLVWTDRGVAAGNIWSQVGADAVYNAGNVGIGGPAGTSKLLITGADALTLSAAGGTYLTWRDTTSGRSAAISSAGGTLYYRVPDAVGNVLTAGYVDSNGMVTRGRLSVEGSGPYITWADTASGRSAAISSAGGTLYYRVPDAAGNVLTAGYVDSNGAVTRGRLSVEGSGPYITWADTASGRSATISSANGTLYYRVPNAVNTVVTAGYVDSNGLVVNGRVAVTDTVNATHGIVIGNNPGTIDAPIYSDSASSSRVVLWNTATAGLMDLVCHQGSVSSLVIRGGADLAEPFAMSHPNVEPGSVVVIDELNPGKLRQSTRAYDQKVAGIVSGANGIHPGISMTQEDELEAGKNVALSGRVYVRADASLGSISPGDLLTTSDTPGHAMKVADHTQAQGAILGKAMSSLKDGRGLVLVLVTLQ